MKKNRTRVLSIAGFDPSGGAGILADIKTFEACKVTGFGITTGITIQNESEFHSSEWISNNLIQSQLDILLIKHSIDFVKIGLVKNLEMLDNIIDILLSYNKDIKIIWDPILKASAGFEFYKPDNITLEKIAGKIYLITPNLNEIQTFYEGLNPIEGAQKLAKYCCVFLKGGHNQNNPGKDFLFESGKQISFRAKNGLLPSKHGSGCVLSSAITAYLAKGYKLQRACLKAKNYTAEFLQSSDELIGYHKI